MMDSGIKEILRYAYEGIKKWQEIEHRDKKQLGFNL